MGVVVHEICCGPYRAGTKSVSDFLKFPMDIVRQARIIRRLLDQTHFDLIYVNGGRLLPAAAIALSGRVPLIFHAHWRYQGAAARMARWSIRKSAATVIGYCRYVTPPLNVPCDRLHVISNGVADCGFRERSFDLRTRLRIGIIGRIAPEKGHIEFLKAARLLAREFSGARFVICGAPLFSDRRYEGEIRRLARGLPVEFLGWQDDVAGVLKELDLLVVASTREGPPRVLLEAFSAGVPVVAFPAGGIPEALDDEQTGFLTADCSAEALALRIGAVLTGDPARLRQVARNARRGWERYYNVSRFRSRITRLLADLASASPGAARTAAQPPRISPRPAEAQGSIPADR
jgi:glycosyltransferase involved in cell wall biosynthesis